MKKKTLTPGLLLIALLIGMAGCRRDAAKSADFDLPVYEPTYASGFSITGAEGRRSTLITVRNPWQGADSVGTELLIVRDGEPVPEGFGGQVIEGPARRVIAMSSTHVALLDAIGAAATVVGASGTRFITNPTARKAGDVGFEGNIDYELLAGLDPDIVLLYGVNGASTMEGKLKELGIPYMYVGDYLEESPLGKAEWMVALAELTGRRAEGEKTFGAIPPRYDALRRRVADAHRPAPKVMINMPYNDTWFMPSTTSYAVRLIADAGGEYIYGRNTGNASQPVDLEEAYLLASQADVWLNPGQARTLAEVGATVPKFTDTPPFRNGRVYNNNRRTTPEGGNDYYESGVARPDVVLRDLIGILHPGLVDDDPVYYQQLR